MITCSCETLVKMFCYTTSTGCFQSDPLWGTIELRSGERVHQEYVVTFSGTVDKFMGILVKCLQDSVPKINKIDSLMTELFLRT